MVNVLHIMSAADAGGVSAVVLNYYQWINRDTIHFDLALTTDEIGLHAEEFRRLGSNIYRLPLKSNGLSAYIKALEKILKLKHFDAIHVHENETSYIALMTAKKKGVSIRIAHAHYAGTSSSLTGVLRRISGYVLNYCFATDLIGCGKLAGEFVFGKIGMSSNKALVLPNAVDTEKFAFSLELRIKTREQLNVQDKYVVTMVARLSNQKNHFFALALFKRYHDINPNAVLLLVGDGENGEKIQAEIENGDMGSYVFMTGRRSDVEAIYQASDVLLLPSLYEGFPVVAVEAMSSGLPLLLSDKITNELSFGSAVRYIQLNDINAWITALHEFESDTADARIHRSSEPKEKGFDIRNNTRLLSQLYLRCQSKEKGNTSE